MRVRAGVERQQRQTAVARQERVRLAVGTVDDRVALDDLVGLALLPAQAVAGEHVEDLLLLAVHVHRHLAAARRNLEPAGADPGRAGGGTQPAAIELDIALGR